MVNLLGPDWPIKTGVQYKQEFMKEGEYLTPYWVVVKNVGKETRFFDSATSQRFHLKIEDKVTGKMK